MTRWAILLVAINIHGAIRTVYLRAGFFAPNGYAFALPLLAANATLALAGLGKAVMDAMFVTWGH